MSRHEKDLLKTTCVIVILGFAVLVSHRANELWLAVFFLVLVILSLIAAIYCVKSYCEDRNVVRITLLGGAQDGWEGYVEKHNRNLTLKLDSSLQKAGVFSWEEAQRVADHFKKHCGKKHSITVLSYEAAAAQEEVKRQRLENQEIEIDL